MTLAKGDHLVLFRKGKIVKGESLHEFEVLSSVFEYYDDDKPVYVVRIRVVA